jgi:hypothetical protein
LPRLLCDRRIADRWDNQAMFRWLTRFVLFRFLPRRLLPILTIIELARLVRGLRRPRLAVNEPTESRTAQPPRHAQAPAAGERSETRPESGDEAGAGT